MEGTHEKSLQLGVLSHENTGFTQLTTIRGPIALLWIIVEQCVPSIADDLLQGPHDLCILHTKRMRGCQGK